MGQNLLEIEKVTKIYKGRRSLSVKAVSEVSFSVKQGELFGIVGESGCGKSTLTKMILSLEYADNGSLVFEGKDLSKLKRKELRPYRRNIQSVFQDSFSSLNPRMKVKDIISEPLKNYKEKYEVDKLQELLNDVGLGKEALEKYPCEFSGGQRQRVSIARALALSPKCIIFDEPTSSLDMITENNILNLIKKLNKEKGIGGIFISHNIKAVLKVCSRVAVMKDGKILEILDTNNLKPKNDYSKMLFKNCNVEI